MFRRLAYLAGAFAILVFAGCGSTPGATGTDISPATHTVLQRGDFERSLLLTGELQAVHSIAIKAPILRCPSRKHALMTSSTMWASLGRVVRPNTVPPARGWKASGF